MKFLTIGDLKTVLRDDEIKLIDDQTKFDYFESVSISMIETYIGGIYSLEQEWVKTDFKRNIFLLKCVLALFRYEYYNVVSSNNIPFNITELYKETIDLLKAAGSNKQPLFGLQKKDINLDPTRTTYRQFYTPQKLNTYW